MSEIIIAFGLVLAVEGLLYAAFPAAMKAALEVVAHSPTSSLRLCGLGAAIVGTLVIWLAKHYV